MAAEMDRELRETAEATERFAVEAGGRDGVPWPWNVPDGAWTLDLYYALPVGDGNRYEVIGGELHLSPSPGEKQQWTSSLLHWKLMNWAMDGKKGQV